MTQPITVQFGKRRYTLLSSRYDTAEHIGCLTVRDDLGSELEIEAGGLLPCEMRQEIVAFAMRRAAQ